MNQKCKTGVAGRTRNQNQNQKIFFTGVAGRLVKSEKEAEWLEAEKVTEVQVNIH